jgi:hypothetical protein
MLCPKNSKLKVLITYFKPFEALGFLTTADFLISLDKNQLLKKNAGPWSWFLQKLYIQCLAALIFIIMLINYI